MKLSVSDEISGKFQNHSFMSKECLARAISNVTDNKNELVGKNIRLSTTKNHKQPVLIFFKFVHPRLLL